jgi:hypothetical protein
MKSFFTPALFSSSLFFSAAMTFVPVSLLVAPVTASADASLNGEALVLLDGNLNASSPSRLAGSGVVRFAVPQSNFGLKTGHLLRFELPATDSSVSFVFYGQQDLSQGYTLSFTRLADNSLEVLSSANDQTIDISRFFDAGVDYPKVKTSENMNVTFKTDTHNDEQPLHNLIWSGSEASPSESNTIFNSEADGVETPGTGKGSFRGIVIQNAAVSISRISTPFLLD